MSKKRGLRDMTILTIAKDLVNAGFKKGKGKYSLYHIHILVTRPVRNWRKTNGGNREYLFKPVFKNILYEGKY